MLCQKDKSEDPGSSAYQMKKQNLLNLFYLEDKGFRCHMYSLCSKHFL